MSSREVVALAPASRSVADPSRLSAAVLAYIGDAVFELYARLAALEAATAHREPGGETADGAVRVKSLHRVAGNRTRAGGQARILAAVWPHLDEEERGVVRRARNARPRRRPARVAPREYRASTGLEALLGFLYLAGRTGRIAELLGRLAGGEGEQAGSGAP